MLKLIMALFAVLQKYSDRAVVSGLLVVTAVVSFLQERGLPRARVIDKISRTILKAAFVVTGKFIGARLILLVHWNQYTKEMVMKTKVGLWIDHRRAIIMAITDNGEEMGLVISEVEKQPRRSGDSPLKGSYESVQVPADDSRQRAFTGHLNIYYDAVIASIRGAESILIFGPGEAKDELEERLKKKNLGGRIVAIETVDKMTDRQIAAKVREHFAE